MPPRPRTPKQPQDHKQKAVQAEAQGDDITFTHDGVDYTIVRADVDDLKLWALIRSDPMSALERLFGEEKFLEFVESQEAHADEKGRIPMVPAFQRLIEAMTGAAGGNP